MIRHYTLNDKGEPVPCDLWGWAKMLESREGVVKQEYVGKTKISTVFLGMDHNFLRLTKEPILWETMVFGGKLDGEMRRCAGNRSDAIRMHKRMVALVKRRNKKKGQK